MNPSENRRGNLRSKEWFKNNYQNTQNVWISLINFHKISLNHNFYKLLHSSLKYFLEFPEIFHFKPLKFK